VDLEIRRGECLLIAGSNGSGKTVFMRILAGLMEATAGEISPPPADLRTGLVFQDADAQILGETVEEDVSFGPRNLKLSKGEIRERTEGAMAAMGLGGKRDFPPRRLSGGEKRRLAVAGVLAMGRDTVILDEPFANLDWPGVVQVLKILGDLKKTGKTVILLTHELEKALAFADRLVILDRGRVRAGGSPEAVLDRLDPGWGVRDPRRSYRGAADCSWLED
jgi:biotin transport system ATP-binding protein